ncbi:hypothetical protein LB553_25650 [Mesorhizobium sp. CA8]|uniref:hypothetical protein n=1 Tax=unclassified Mesorhizobium TaxID=325217 RepID=UPI001CCB7368|nr:MULTISPECIES: hypothetical protein [unclassified Mesorhizobium]MBZ9764238.1 hypothetical protein [Mesorhizobium sp. CA8]MBZ9823096.1 hypothetical protein [Mesorhizobium sp. CA4]
MPKKLKQKKGEESKPSGVKPEGKPPKDTRANPAPNPEGLGELPDTNTREEVEAIRPNLKR